MILIVGCGFLGAHILKHISMRSKEQIIATVREMKNAPQIENVEYVKCDVTNKEDLEALAKKCQGVPLTVIYLAACHNIDYVYENADKAQKINVDALENFIKTMPKINKLFFASTDCVYGDGDFKFSEKSTLNPVNQYGRQKIEAENIICRYGFTVLRFPFMLGRSLTTKPHFYDNVCSKLLNNESVEMIDGMKRSVLDYDKAAELIYSLSLLPSEKLPDVINVCGDNLFSKYEVGCVIADKLGAPVELIKKISEQEGEKFFKDKRASCTAMDNTLLKSLLGLEKIEWKV